MSQEPVTVFISRQIKPGREADIEAWSLGVREACSQFPGYISSKSLERHGEGSGPTHFDVLVTFESCDALKAWERSDIRQEWYAKLEPLIEFERMSRIQGFEPWFPPPQMAGSPPRPHKLKMWFMTFICVYPLVVLVLYAIGPFMPTDIPIWVRLLISVPIVSFLMAFFVMPFLSKVFARWLYPDL